MKKRFATSGAAAVVAIGLFASPAAGAQTDWWSTTYGEWQDTCGRVEHGHSQARAYIDSSCRFSQMGVRAKYFLDNGSTVITSWKTGTQSAEYNGTRIYQHQAKSYT